MASKLTSGQLAALAEVARAAAEDIAEYTTKRGTPTWDDERAGRMLARDPVIAVLLPMLLAEHEALTVEVDYLHGVM